jgi:hypothetical protein
MVWYHEIILGHTGCLEALDLQILAGVVLTPFTGTASSANKLGPGSGLHTRFDVLYLLANRFYSGRVFMTLYDGVGGCRVFSMEYMDVTAADSNPLNFQ